MKEPSRPWFGVRKELSPKRRLLLTFVSFLGPLFVWALVSYCPSIWHPDVRLQITAERDNVTTMFSAGDHVSKAYFPGFVADVKAENEKTLAAREGNAPTLSPFRARRSNQKLMRQIAAPALANGWLTPANVADDAAIYEVWRKLANDKLKGGRVLFSDDNLAIVKRNWALMAAGSDTFDAEKLPDIPLEKLLPQGVPANPVYLPAPDEVWRSGYADFTAPATSDHQSMWQRYKQSIYIIFSGFILSCIIGVPLGILCGTFDFISKLCEPFTDFFRYMPAPVFSTLLVAVFLAYDAPKIMLVFIGTFFQLVLVVANTTRQLDVSLLEAAQTLGARRATLVTRVILPGILPNLYNDLRILLGWSWTWLVIAELIGVKSGLTEFIETQGRWRHFDHVYPAIILIGVTGFTMDQLLSYLRVKLFPWTPEAANSKANKNKGLFGSGI
jgi:NitT/TauT family transport system permease protein